METQIVREAGWYPRCDDANDAIILNVIKSFTTSKMEKEEQKMRQSSNTQAPQSSTRSNHLETERK